MYWLCQQPLGSVRPIIYEKTKTRTRTKNKNKNKQTNQKKKNIENQHMFKVIQCLKRGKNTVIFDNMSCPGKLPLPKINHVLNLIFKPSWSRAMGKIPQMYQMEIKERRHGITFVHLKTNLQVDQNRFRACSSRQLAFLWKQHSYTQKFFFFFWLNLLKKISGTGLP